MTTSTSPAVNATDASRSGRNRLRRGRLVPLTAVEEARAVDATGPALGRPSRPGRGRRVRRALVAAGLAVVAVVAAVLPTAAPAHAQTSLTISSHDSAWWYYNWEWYYNLSSGQWEPVTIELSNYVTGQARYCWYWTSGCWIEQVPWQQGY